MNLPHYKVETEGHWRKLSPRVVGHDRYGKQITGKTWVKSSNPWKKPKEYTRPIFVKDSIKAAKLKISEYIEAAKKVGGEKIPKDVHNHNQNHGELYVMRCSAMKEPTFKVGFTNGNSNQRAEQLSSATGVPLSFVVVKAWKHHNASALETEVHMMLAPYRINVSREFFLAKFSVIESAIKTAIKRNS